MFDMKVNTIIFFYFFSEICCFNISIYSQDGDVIVENLKDIENYYSNDGFFRHDKTL